MDPEILALFTPINEAIAALGERVAVIETRFQPLVEQVEKLAADVESLNSGTRYTDDRITEIARNMYTEMSEVREVVADQQAEIVETAEKVDEVVSETPPAETVAATEVPASTLPHEVKEELPESRQKKRPHLI